MRIPECLNIFKAFVFNDLKKIRQMKISVIDAGNFKLDGGAMFGVVPKTLWSKKIPSDDLNLCSWKMRCLLIEIEQRLILIDTGMGNKQSEKWQSYYFKHGQGDLINSIRNAGYHEEQITDVILSHLHFDHAGGAVSWNTTRDKYELTFKNAIYWTHSIHWQSALNPNAREAATFLKENLLPIEQLGHLKFVDLESNLPACVSFLTANGHTEQMLMPIIKYQNKEIIFMADTIPSHAHIHIPWVMGYDIRPLETMNEKEILLKNALEKQQILFFDHDPFFDICTIQYSEKGYSFDFAGTLDDIFLS